MPTVQEASSIPFIDFAHDVSRHVVVDREADQYLGHPTTVLLEDGRTMWIVYPKGHGRGAIVLKHSGDGGRTWSERLPVPETWASSKEVPTLYRTVDEIGCKRLLMFSGLYPIRSALSEDDGATWSELEPIGNYGGIVAMSDLIRLKDRRYVALFHDDGRFLNNSMQKSEEFVVYAVYSNDGGVTWGQPIEIVRHQSAHLCEPCILRSPDGNQLCIILRENSRKYNSMVIFSDDEGKNWTKPRELPDLLTGDRHQSLYVKDGRILISFRDMARESSTWGDWVGWVGTYEDLVYGNDGQYKLRFMINNKGSDCAYPALELLPDQIIFTSTYGHWTENEEPYIAGIHFTMDEIDLYVDEKGL